MEIKIQILVIKNKYIIFFQQFIFNISDKSEFKFMLDYTIEDDHLKIIKSKIDGPLARVQYHFENLFNGNKQLGDEMNKFMNDNWEDVAKDMKPSFDETLATVVASAISNLASKVPYSQMFI